MLWILKLVMWSGAMSINRPSHASRQNTVQDQEVGCRRTRRCDRGGPRPRALDRIGISDRGWWVGAEFAGATSMDVVPGDSSIQSVITSPKPVPQGYWRRSAIPLAQTPVLPTFTNPRHIPMSSSASRTLAGEIPVEAVDGILPDDLVHSVFRSKWSFDPVRRRAFSI
jgi:hypothetical protein